ncbi:hypothetical protein CGCS363_v014590 [Colletotrichum siamense]|uniref:uncharacterized protein n=1 Tax=Colletotrichum siamense TaxID=690259 RepID=UPI0018731ED6|nr:uncharacterized protein CGCS363_v014590 [Colletotrichum siamense]KAF5485414.1 hypothetical protein CGCS363_v014590 [Colletotrichum siamense]
MQLCLGSSIMDHCSCRQHLHCPASFPIALAVSFILRTRRLWYRPCCHLVTLVRPCLSHLPVHQDLSCRQGPSTYWVFHTLELAQPGSNGPRLDSRAGSLRQTAYPANHGPQPAHWPCLPQLRPRQLCRFQCHRRVPLRNPLSTLTRKAMPTLDATSTSRWPAPTIPRCNLLNLPDPALPELAHLPQIFRVAEVTTLVALMCGLATSAVALNVLEASVQMKRVSVESFSVVVTQTLTYCREYNQGPQQQQDFSCETWHRGRLS